MTFKMSSSADVFMTGPILCVPDDNIGGLVSIEFPASKRATRHKSLNSINVGAPYVWPQLITPQIEGKFTATPGGLTNVVYGCID